MKAAIVTGASSGIGLEISKMLKKNGYNVFGIARSFDEKTAEQAGMKIYGGTGGSEDEAQIYMIECDILDTDKLCAEVKKITAENELYILVNNAGEGYYGLHEELNPKKIQNMVRINLETPMILAQQTLRHLKKNKGFIINIASVTAVQSSPHGCAYGASKAGLLGFSRSLFDEVRKYGVRVTAVIPDMTRTNLYRNADFCASDEEGACLEPSEVADAVEYAVTGRNGLVVQEIMLKPQFHRIKRK